MTEITMLDWVKGDRLRLDLPAHPEALEAGGPDFLTRAFRASGALAPDNRVNQISRIEEWLVGGTGTKAQLSVAYERDVPGLPRNLFVKFSRNFYDRVRDSARHHMEPEVRLANLSLDPAFPVAVPKCMFAAYHHETGTGVLITERIPYDHGTVEPHHPKCMDQLVPDPLGHYRALVSSLARLAGTHKSGALGESVERDFPFNLDTTIANGRNPTDPQLLAKRMDRLVQFIAEYSHLFPPHLTDPDFLADLRADVLLVNTQQDAIRLNFFSQPDMIALCHWNANIDNAWFWREPDGSLRCGLIDWGNVGQTHVCQAIWGSIGGSEPDLIDRYLGELLDLFIADYAGSGGPMLDKAEVERNLDLQVLLGLASMTTAPPAILREVPDPAVAADRYDRIFSLHETARVQLKVTISYLNMWHRRNLGRLLREGGEFWQN